jgi:hypothetical protein
MNSAYNKTDYDDFLVSLGNLLERISLVEGANYLINSHRRNSLIISCFSFRAKQLGLKCLSEMYLLASYALQSKENSLIVYRKGASQGLGVNKVTALVDLRSQLSYINNDKPIEQLTLSDGGQIVWVDTTGVHVEFIREMKNSKQPSTDELVTAMEMAFALGDAWESAAREFESKLFDRLHGLSS